MFVLAGTALLYLFKFQLRKPDPSKIDRLLAECTLKFAAFGISIEPAPNDRALIVRASIQDIRSGVSDRSAPIPSTFLD